MKCRDAKRLMDLSRPGELTVIELDALDRHCASCPACAAERTRARQSESLLARLRAVKPEPRNGDILTASILARVREQRQKTHNRSTAEWFDRIASWLEIPLLRYASALFITVTLLSFVTQLLAIMHSITDLEARLARGPRPQARFAYAINMESVMQMKEAKELDRLLPSRIVVDADKKVIVSSETLAALQEFITSRSAATEESLRAKATIDSLVHRLEKEGAVSLQLISEGETR